MFKPFENYYKNLFEPDRGYARKQDLNRDKCSKEMTVCSFFAAFRIKEGNKKDYLKVGESKGVGLQDSVNYVFS